MLALVAGSIGGSVMAWFFERYYQRRADNQLTQTVFDDPGDGPRHRGEG